MKKLTISSLLLAASLLQGTILNEFPSLSMNSDGEVVAFWQGYDNTYNVSVARSATLPFGGSWSSPVDVSPAGKLAMYPKVAINPSGQMIGVWEVVLGNSFSIQAVAGAFGSGWGGVELISESTSEDTFPEIDIDGSGNGVLLWQKKVGGAYEVRTASYNSTTHSWGSPVTLSAPSRTMPFPEAVVNSSGKAFAFWQQFVEPANQIQVSSFSSEEGWSTPTVLSDPTYNSTNVQAVINDPGQVVALWQKGGETAIWIEAAIASPEGIWGEATSLSLPNEISVNPMAVMNASGKIVAVWQSAYPEDVTLQVVQSAIYSDGVWSAPVSLSDPSLKAASPSIAINSAGKAVLAWTANGVVQSALLSSENMWSTVAELSDPASVSFYPQAGIDAAGNGVVVWQINDGTDTQIQSSVYTAGGSWSSATTISN